MSTPATTANAETQHTPGPWMLDVEVGTPWNVVTVKGGEAIALASQVVGDDSKQSRRTVNARLIAAAPELLEALAFYVSICGNTAHSIDRQTAEEMYAKGFAALSKALGKQ